MFVIYHSSDSFAGIAGVSMVSLFENNKHFPKIHVHYIERDMTDENKELLLSIAIKYGRTIEFMEMPNWSDKLNIELKSCKDGWLGFGYNRLFLTEYISCDIDRVLYLDCDTIVEGPLDDLWNTDLTGYYLAGVDDCLSRKYRRIVGVPTEGTYCNAGMLLINLQKWREDNVKQAFIDQLYLNNGYFVFNEQSLINSLFAGKIKILPQKYNVNSLVYVFDYKELMKLRRPQHFSYCEQEYKDAKFNPVITHYTGLFYVERRPWIELSDHPHRDAFFKYKALSPWKNTPFYKDRRSIKTKIYTRICHILPRPFMIYVVSLLYNDLRPIWFELKLRKVRGICRNG
ncbi:glycosyltransferase family 8 protein [Diplocloster agilis]|uniref:glycosyltransferase family 8 protein n=1 Tax=Diplocloster agilis TaxID=2850323 RepID=UPI00082330B1|nr:glycosyltransferase family 8 protein [Suonthocola fibrivorans]MCU6733089.1 glycosyltransferase family 8 protein [Suonthocola fibrivorans]SCI75068.1 General stress protein A [uncultured Clostridium sp.]